MPTSFLQGLPVANHPLFKDFWDRYTHNYNTLTDLLERKNIDIDLLRATIGAAQDIERLSFDYKTKSEKGEM